MPKRPYQPAGRTYFTHYGMSEATAIKEFIGLEQGLGPSTTQAGTEKHDKAFGLPGWLENLFASPDGSASDSILRVAAGVHVLLAFLYLFNLPASLAAFGMIAAYAGINLGVFWLMKNGYRYASRAIVGYISPMLVYLFTVMVYPARYAQVDEGSKMVLLALAISPFLIYKLEQPRLLISNLVFNALLLITVDFGVANFPFKIDGVEVHTNYTRFLGALQALFFLTVIFYTYKKNAATKEREIKTLLDALTENAASLGQMNAQLQQSQKQLAQMNETKNKLFSIIAHDLRTPLNSFEGFSHLLTEHINQLSPEEIKEMTLSMRHSFTQVKSLLENLLSWSRSQMNIIQHRPVEMPVGVVLEQIATMYGPTAQAKGVRLVKEYLAEIPVIADPDLMSVILRNLVSNAIKYSHKNGRITISAEPIGQEQLCISVHDEGIGMGPEVMQNLFRIDKKISTPGTSNEKGTGLGLILAKEFARTMKSDLEVVSVPGEGTTFFFHVPLASASEEPKVSASTVLMSGR